MGMNVGQLYQKHYWVFLAFIIAGERMAGFFTAAPDEMAPYAEYEEDFLPQQQFV